MTLTITRLDLSAADLRDAAARTREAKAARRMLAIGLVLEGWSRESAAEACAMDRQTLCDWVHRYNELGVAGLFDRPRRNGPRPRLSAEQQATVAEWVEQGAQLERDGVIRWRCVDLQRRIAEEFAVQLHERTVGKLLRKLSFRRLSVGGRDGAGSRGCDGGGCNVGIGRGSIKYRRQNRHGDGYQNTVQHHRSTPAIAVDADLQEHRPNRAAGRTPSRDTGEGRREPIRPSSIRL
jgi:transposase